MDYADFALGERETVAAALQKLYFEGVDWSARLVSGSARLSVVVPFYNEEGNLRPLYDRLKPVLEQISPLHEIILVNDGSRDASLAEAVELCAGDDVVTLIHFPRNFGKAAGLASGFQRAKGDLVVMMDADLQDQPEEIWKLIDKLSMGYDLVTGWKKVRHDPIHKTWPSKLFNKTVSRAFGLSIHDFNCGLKAMKISVAQELRLYGDFHRFIPALAADMGYRVTEQQVEHAPRLRGVSKYGGKRLITGLLDFLGTLAVTKYFHKPMQFFGALALKVLFLAAIVGAYLAVTTVLTHGYHLRPMWIIFGLLAIGGVQILSLGLIGELVVNVLRRSHGVAEFAMPTIVNAADLRELPDAPQLHVVPLHPATATNGHYAVVGDNGAHNGSLK